MTQEVFLKAYQKLRTLKRWDKFLSWVYAITSNSRKDFLRSKASRPDGEYVTDQEKERLDKISINSHHEDKLHQTLREALSELPEIHRQVLSLHYLGGLSCREIAQFLGISPHAIAMRLSRALAKLRKEMLTMMHSSFDGQKLHSAFTLNIVEIIRRTQIQPNPQVPAIPIGIAVVSLLTLSMLYLFVSVDQFPAIGKLVGAPILSETRIAEVGEIPVDVVMLPNTSVVSSGDGKRDLMQTPRQTNEVYVANAHTEFDTSSRNEPTARLGNGTVRAVAYSPDGSLIAIAGAIGIWFYDAETLAEVGMISGGAGAIAFSPDGQMLASGSGSEPTAFLWNVKTQKRIGSLTLPGRRGITALTYALDGKTLAVGYTNGDIALWDTATQQKTALLDTASSVLWTLAFSPNGRLLASGGYKDSTISLWDVQTKTLLGAFDGHTRDTRAQNHGVSTIAFSPDGKTLASGSGFDCTVRLWDVAVRTEIALLLELDTYELEGINSVVFSPNGTLLASASDDAAIRMWDTRTLEQIGALATKSGGVTSITFRPDGIMLASLNGQVAGTARHQGGDMSIRLWDVESQKPTAEVGHYNASVESVALSPDGTLLAAGCQDGAVELWDIGSRKRIDVMQGHGAMVQCVAFSPDGSLLASSAKEHARLWNIEDRKQIAIFNHTAIVESIAFSSDSKTLACVDDNCIRLWDTRRKRAVSVLGEVPLPSQASFRELSLLKTLYLKWIRRESPTDLPVHYASTIQSIAFSPDGKMLISGGIDNAVRLWDIRKRREIFTHKQDQKDVDSANIQAVAFSPGGDIFASAGTHKEIHLWSVAEHKLIGTLNTEEHVEALPFNPDGRFLAAGVRANIRVWDMETLAEVATLEGCLGAVKTFAFSGDGKTLVASAGHGVIRVWDSSGLGSD